MASIRKIKSGYRAEVCVLGHRDSSVFRTLREANAWASSREHELRIFAKSAPADKHTLAELLEAYKEKVSPTKRGCHWETLRIDKFLRDSTLPIEKPLSACSSAHIREWRDTQTTKANSIIREMGMLSSFLNMAG